jgi:serine/threonine protein kinase
VQRFIHRDLNPRHVLLDWNWNIQICDFGFWRRKRHVKWSEDHKLRALSRSWWDVMWF